MAINGASVTTTRDGSRALDSQAPNHQQPRQRLGFSDQAVAIMLARREQALKVLAEARLRSVVANVYQGTVNRSLPSPAEIQLLLLQQQQQLYQHPPSPSLVPKSPPVASRVLSSPPIAAHHALNVEALTRQPSQFGVDNHVSVAPPPIKRNTLPHPSTAAGLSSIKTERNEVVSSADPPSKTTSSGKDEGVDPQSLVKHSFPEKIYFMLEAVSNDTPTVVSFVDNGTAFLIHKPRIFETEIMPLYFSSSRMSSFQRQLNIYGFQRVDKGQWRGSYRHPYFVQGKPDLLKKIKRCSSNKKR